MDTDSIFLTSPEMIWNYFKEMNSSQIIGMTRVGEIPNAPPYNENYGMPFYGTTGNDAF
jgi:hypothetical protein